MVQQGLFSRIAYAAKYIETNLEEHTGLPVLFAGYHLFKSRFVKNKIRIEVEFIWDHDFSNWEFGMIIYCDWTGIQNLNHSKLLL